ncbi:MAG: hypothetical protein Q8908_11750 [Bacteroidota bacterium]|nr:hypothetical protein [Bacteroidota bacterium]
MYKLILIAILMAGCISLPLHNKKYLNRIHLLTNDSVKFWYDAWRIPYFPDYTEGGIVLFKHGDLINYQINYENKRVITDNLSEDIFCTSPKYYLKSDKFYLVRCGYTYIFKIVKLTDDTLQLNEITKYNYFEDSVPIIFRKSKDQVTRPVKGDLINPDPNTWPIKSIPAIK